MKKLGLFLISVFMMTSCVTNEAIQYTVASATADCVGVAPQKCLQVKKGVETEWTLFYSSIEGFNYEPGYEYVLDVKEEKNESPAADASSIKYTLVKEVSKTKKTSENMLPILAVTKDYEWTGKVLSVEGANVGVGAAKDKFAVTVVKIEVTSSNNSSVLEAGSIIHCELAAEPKVKPEVSKEYTFRAKDAHPAHALGVYMLNTEVMDLVK